MRCHQQRHIQQTSLPRPLHAGADAAGQSAPIALGLGRTFTFNKESGSGPAIITQIIKGMLQGQRVRWPATRALLSGCASRSRRVHAGWRPGLSTLAIETSCDDTSVALLEIQQDNTATVDPRQLRTHVAYHERITANSAAYNGIHPLVALHSHQTSLGGLVADALAKNAGARPTFVSVTRGPGMRSNLTVGLELAKGLALAWGVPLVGVHHMQAHSLTPRLCSTLETLPDLYQGPWEPTSLQPPFPYLSVLASGGHTMLVNSAGLTDHQILATTGDIAIGDCLDKAARALLPSDLMKPPYGKALEDFAFPNGASDYNYIAPANRGEELTRRATRWGWSLGVPLAESKGGEKSSRRMAFSFAGLLTSIQRFMRQKVAEDGTITAELRDPESISIEERRDLACEVLRVSFEHLASRILIRLEDTVGRKVKVTPVDDAKEIDTVVISGGVASNRYLRHLLRAMLDARDYAHIKTIFPPPSLCTDNALMIAWAGMEMYTAGYQSTFDITPIRKWSMDPRAEDGGILGAEGWLHHGTPLPAVQKSQAITPF
jgi:N6-L-threonylcarbamoyladenine synthase